MNKEFDQINIEPLIALRSYFSTSLTDSDSFNMSRYAQDKSGNSLLPHDVPEYGTSMCLLGHLPLLGYPGLEDEGWVDYCNRILNIDVSLSEDEIIFVYLFVGFWRSDVQLAITRLDDVINRRKSSIIIDEENVVNRILISNYNRLFDHD